MKVSRRASRRRPAPVRGPRERKPPHPRGSQSPNGAAALVATPLGAAPTERELGTTVCTCNWGFVPKQVIARPDRGQPKEGAAGGVRLSRALRARREGRARVQGESVLDFTMPAKRIWNYRGLPGDGRRKHRSRRCSSRKFMCVLRREGETSLGRAPAHCVVPCVLPGPKSSRRHIPLHSWRLARVSGCHRRRHSPKLSRGVAGAGAAGAGARAGLEDRGRIGAGDIAPVT